MKPVKAEYSALDIDTCLDYTQFRQVMDIKTSPELLPGTLYMLILRTLRGGPLHGYGIAKSIREASLDGLAIEDGSLYPALNRMLVKGWVTAEWGISEKNRKARFYKLTPEGRKTLAKEAGEFAKMVRSIQLVMDGA
jgi:PadR family transcriptional regulator, regulatory protein PadR